MIRRVSIDDDSRMVESVPRRTRKRTPSDVRREARRNAERQAAVRVERVEDSARTREANPYMADKLDHRQHGLDAEKLSLRGEVRIGLGTTEAASYNGPVSMRGTRS